MSLAVLERKQEYVEHATDDIERELRESAQIFVLEIELNAERARIRVLIGDCLETIEQMYELDYSMNEHATEFSPEQWNATYGELCTLFRRGEVGSRRIVALCEGLAARGLTFPKLTGLQAVADRIHGDLNWPTDYANTPAYQAIAQLALADEKAGRLVAGGWE